MEAAPYTHPNTEISPSDSSPRARGRWIARIGVAFFTGPILGLIGTVIGMISAFSTLAENSSAAPEDLADDISVALISTMIGTIIGLLGVILILLAFFGKKNREKWFFWWSSVLSTVWCLTIFPYGMIVGVPILILFISKRAEFLKPTKAQQGSAHQSTTAS